MEEEGRIGGVHGCRRRSVEECIEKEGGERRSAQR